MSKLIYIAGPYSNDDPLIVEEHRYVAIWCAHNRMYYFSPVMNSIWLDDVAPKRFFLDMDKYVLLKCDAIWMGIQ